MSELLEQPIDAETIGLLRQKVTDKTVSTRPELPVTRFFAESWRPSGLRTEEERESVRRFRRRLP